MVEPGLSIFSPPKAPATNPSPATVVRSDAQVRPATSADGVQSSPTITPAQQRWQADRDANRRADPWSDPNITLVKDPVTGVITAKPRVDGVNGVPQPEGQPQPQPGQATVADGFLKFGEFELSEADVRGLMERASIEKSRAATLPASADLYQLTLPSDFKLPDGIEWQFDTNHPVQGALLQKAREFASAAGLSQDQFSRMMSLHVANEVQSQLVFNRARAAELDKLGSLGPSRVDAVRAWVHALTGDAAPELLKVLEAAPMASTIVGFERLMSRWSSQGVGGNPGAARDGASSQPGKVSDEQYQRMSYHERIEYAQKFQQPGG
jgi:hypothetical protein